jgi:xanthine dehydrogenase YagR molybdenum-binding subunit
MARYDREETLKLGHAKNVVEKKVKVAEDAPRPWDMETKFEFVGSKIPRLDGLAKASGRAKYTYDVQLPGMLYAKVVRAPIASGRLKSIDLAPALAIEGVKAAVAGDEIDGFVKVGNRVHFAGEPVAAVCATSAEVCGDAVRAVVAAYERAPHVVTTEDALAPGAPQVFERRPNAPEPSVARESASPDEIAQALATAAVTVDATYRTQVQTHACLETHGCVAHWKKDESGEDSLTVWHSTQGTFSVQEELAGRRKELGLKASQIEVICEYMGGGFGSKFGAELFGIAAAWLSRKTGAPVKLMLDRKEEHLDTGNRPDSVQIVKAGASKEGQLVAWSVRNYGTGGIAEGGAGARNPMIYVPKSMKTRKEEFTVATNAGSLAAMRAPGHPQGIFVVEQVVDELAEKLGMDPIEFRLKNDSHPSRPAQFELGKKLIGWERRNPRGGEGPLAGNGPRKRGLGVGASTWGNNGGSRGGPGVAVAISSDGSVEVRNGAQDIGTGTRTLLAVCVAEELGCPLDKVSVRLGHTRDPHGPASGGSSTAPTLAPAAMEAGHAAKLALLERLSPQLKVAPSELDIGGGRVFAKGDHAQAWKWDEACKKLGVQAVEVSPKRRENFREGYVDRVAGVQLVEAEVDTETGVVRVIKVVAIQDAGTVVNRLTFESQIVGGVIQGISYALFENRVMDRKTGLMLNANLESYKIAGSLDVPEIVAVPFEVANGFNSAGVAGLGEPTVIPTAGAIANAIANATRVRVRELPMTPDRVLAALGSGGKR